ncbi:MAG: hypothetical protein FVQ77_13265 [Cytophagales bacterium]|nr:hypothetical protein [Cytophagales bacterium]
MLNYIYYFAGIVLFTFGCGCSKEPINSGETTTSNGSKSYIDNLKLLPQNPDTSDIIKVVCYTYFPTSECTLDSSTINSSNFQISVFAYYTLGTAGTPCQSIDTLTIGNLNYGNYKLIYNYTVNINFDSITGSDSFYFTVSI